MQSYPHHLIKTLHLDDGTRITLRPIRPADAGIEQEFVRGLSDESRYYRFMEMLRELTPQMLRHFTEIDYQKHMALIAVTAIDAQEREIAVARYVACADGANCEFAIVVADGWLKKGVATALMQMLIEVARTYGIRKMVGEVMSSNHKMLQFTTKLGFDAQMVASDPRLMRVSKDIGAGS